MRTSNKIIIFLVSLNLVATFFFGIVNYLTLTLPKPLEQTVNQDIPDVISTQVKSDILTRFIMYFNSEDHNSLYDMLGVNAKSQSSLDEKAIEFARFNQFFHKIKQGTFNNTKFVGQQGNATLYALIYDIELTEHSELGDSGKLKVTIEIADEEPNSSYQIVNFYLYANRI